MCGLHSARAHSAQIWAQDLRADGAMAIVCARSHGAILRFFSQRCGLPVRPSVFVVVAGEERRRRQRAGLATAERTTHSHRRSLSPLRSFRCASVKAGGRALLLGCPCCSTFSARIAIIHFFFIFLGGKGKKVFEKETEYRGSVRPASRYLHRSARTTHGREESRHQPYSYFVFWLLGCAAICLRAILPFLAVLHRRRTKGGSDARCPEWKAAGRICATAGSSLLRCCTGHLPT